MGNLTHLETHNLGASCDNVIPKVGQPLILP